MTRHRRRANCTRQCSHNVVNDVGLLQQDCIFSPGLTLHGHMFAMFVKKNSCSQDRRNRDLNLGVQIPGQSLEYTLSSNL